MARYIDHLNLPQPPQPNSLHELTDSLTKLVTGFPPLTKYNRHDLHGLYSGPTSIAYLFLHLSKTHPDLLIANRRPIAWCEAYGRADRSRLEVPVTPSRCGAANETLASLAVGFAISDGRHGDLLTAFLDHIPPLVSTSVQEEASNEWLYGRAGTLCFLRLVRHYSPPNPAIEEAIETVVTAIMASGPPWYWHGKNYLGAVHGSIGILTQVLLSSPSRAEQLQPLLEGLLDAQDAKTGNWPSSAGSRGDLVQFCHGAPGFVISLVAVEPFYAGTQLAAKIDAAIQRAREHIWQRGLLTKEPCLCHGAVGNAMALEGEQKDAFMRWMQDSSIRKGLEGGWLIRGDDSWGLFCGEAGRASGWMGGNGMIGYSDV